MDINHLSKVYGFPLLLPSILFFFSLFHSLSFFVLSVSLRGRLNPEECLCF